GCIGHGPVSNETGEAKGRSNRISPTTFTMTLLLVGLHVRGVFAAFGHADCGTDTVAGDRFDEIAGSFVPFELAQTQELLRLRSKNNRGHEVPPRYQDPRNSGAGWRGGVRSALAHKTQPPYAAPSRYRHLGKGCRIAGPNSDLL